MAQMAKMLTAQNIIDAVITQSIQGGADGQIKMPQNAEELELVKATLAAKHQHEEMKAAAAAAQHAQAVVSASQASQQQPQPPPPSQLTRIHEVQVAQAQAAAAAAAQKPNLPADMMLNRELSITPAQPSS